MSDTPVGTPELGNDTSEQPTLQDNLPQESTLEERVEAARKANKELEMEHELARLTARNKLLRSGQVPLTDVIVVPGTNPNGAPDVGILQPKTLRPEKMRAYKGQSVGEHVRWFRDVDVVFMQSPAYFTTEQSRIVFCMQSLEGDPSVEWYDHIKKHPLAELSFETFKTFLLNLVSDPVNRRLTAYEQWEAAKQRPEQKVAAFKSYLEELETHLPPFSAEHRANLFLAKLSAELKNKILSTGNVSNQREEILAQAMMQERILERMRPGRGNNQSKPNQGSQSSKPLEERVTRPNANNARAQDANKRKPESQNPKDTHKDHDHDHNSDNAENICYHCGKPGHIRPNCPDRDKPATYRIGAVSAKNDEAPPEPRKRGRFEEL